MSSSFVSKSRLLAALLASTALLGGYARAQSPASPVPGADVGLHPGVRRRRARAGGAIRRPAVRPRDPRAAAPPCGRAERSGLPARQGERRVDPAAAQVLGLGRPHRDVPGPLPDPHKRGARAARAGQGALPGQADRAADPRRRLLGPDRLGVAGLCRLPGRRRRHGRARLRQLRHARRLQGARAHGRGCEGQDRHRPLRRGLARPQAQARPGARGDRLHHLFRSGRRRLRGGRRLSEGRLAAGRERPARLGPGHDPLSRRPADAGRGRDGRRQAPDAGRGQDDPEDPGPADLLRRRPALPGRARRPAGPAATGAAPCPSPTTPARARRRST